MNKNWRRRTFGQQQWWRRKRVSEPNEAIRMYRQCPQQCIFKLYDISSIQRIKKMGAIPFQYAECLKFKRYNTQIKINCSNYVCFSVKTQVYKIVLYNKEIIIIHFQKIIVIQEFSSIFMKIIKISITLFQCNTYPLFSNFRT